MLGEIADLLEIRADNPFKIRAYRNAAEPSSPSPRASPTCPMPRSASCPASARTWRSAFARLPRQATRRTTRSSSRPFLPRCSTCCGCRAWARRRSSGSTTSSASPRSTTLEAACKDGRVSALKGMGDKKQALILKAIEERKRYAGRHLAAQVEKAARARRLSLEGVVPRRGLHAGRQPPPRRRNLRRPRHPRRRRATGRDGHVHLAPRGRRASSGAARRSRSVLLGTRPAGRPPPGGTQSPGAPRCSISPARRPTTSRCAIERWPRGLRLNEYGLFNVDDRRVAGRRG